VATAVGGLRDTIVPYPDPKATGFTFAHPDAEAFYAAVCRAMDLWRTDKDAWQGMVERAMAQDFSWEQSASQYIDLYRSLGAQL
jgi:starch synthase